MLPVGHGEGRLVAPTDTLAAIEATNQIALQYVDEHGAPTMHYPSNPNGSAHAIAALTNKQGNVLGIMPHPDRAHLPQLHPDWRRSGRAEGDGLRLFRNMVDYVKR
jgi:phosphoribosylformylglycinamidine synthase